MREQSVDATVYDYLGRLYAEIKQTDVEALARICKTDTEHIRRDQQTTLHMIESVQNLVAHKL